MRVLAFCLGAMCLIGSAFAETFWLMEGTFSAAAQAQTVPKSLEEGGSDAALRIRKNSWTLGVAGGQLSGTFMTFAHELAEVLNDGDNLRVIPIVVDIAVTQADVFEYFRTQRRISNLETRINYIIR